MTSDYLFELGTEELPPKNLKILAESLQQSVLESFAVSKLKYEKFQLFCTPRRLAFLVYQLDDATPVSESLQWGPPAKIAFDEAGKATKAALSFCQRNGIEESDIEIKSDGKVEKICCLKKLGGEDVSQLIPSIIQNALDQLPIAKRMRWGAQRTEFVRPVQWLVLMRNSELIPASILGCSSSKESRGHRFLCDKPITIQSASSYEQQLFEEAKVIADFARRQRLIQTQVAEQAKTIGGHAVVDTDLLDEVTALVEWPVALSGNFEEDFLKVPAEALISSMKEHQKYFHLVDDENKLLPSFITVANIESNDLSAVVTGNEKVIRPRLADAAFFFETDKKVSLKARREKLKTVVFQAKLGTMYEKTERIKALAVYIAETLGESVDDAAACAELCKSDLVSNMVYEFPEMQGIAAYHYALNDRLDSKIAKGLVEHYLPKFAGDKLPEQALGAIIGLADRLDTLTGIFSIGQTPSGSKDPFGLRRASLASLRIIVELGYDLDLADLVSRAISLHREVQDPGATEKTVLNYVLERFKAWYEEADIPNEVWLAVSAKGLTKPQDIDKRVHAVHAFYKTDAAKALAAANKRVANILAKGEADISSKIDVSLFTQDEEAELYQQLSTIKAKIQPLLKNMDYGQALNSLSSLRDAVDAYFANVMVMADQNAVRQNRLAMLMELREEFLNIADIRFLAPSKE